ncbi:ankyrin repeat-containing domain protein [Boeremia exigua]|uniref:ankyrin repeat-containing domain protein n=1 Tax=Boeremia exigua TaxID=749465 RepID=UPI001E8E743B|nr:ankyrin repeat-containing domain protein [Boeremia exigua]KAH6616443.1 ankyrin repeat-containing domain protein [Boeremia exigua]
MAPARKDSTIALCKKVNTQGNTVSIRMLEYLSSSKEPVHGFLALANTFLDLVRLVWTIEAGIEESFKTRKTYPVEITSELDARFRHIYDEFIVLSQMVSKFIDNDNGKGGLGKRMRMMFADSEVDKVRMALLKSIESLKMSSAIFRWTLGDDHAEETVAIGYAGLIAALERNNPSKPPSAPPQRGLPQPPAQAQQPAKSEHTRPEPLLPPPNLTSRASHPDIPSNGNTNGHSHEELRMSPDAPFAHNEWRASSIQSGGSVQNAMHSSSDRSSEGHAHKHYDEPNYSRMPMREHNSHLNTPEQRFQYSGNMAHRQMESPIIRSSTMHHPEHRSLGGKEGVIVAVRQGQYRVVEQLLAGGVKMDRIEFASLLHTSIDNKDAATTSILLRFGADADAPDTDGTSPLCAATKAASVDCARILLKHGADANFKDNEGTTALFKAIQAGSVDIMTVLLDNGANPNLPCPKHPLWPSCYHPEALGLMLSRGADHKRTPGIMELAASLKKLKSVKILIEAGVSPNVRKDGAYTPLASAIRDNSADIVTYLLDNGADPNLKAVEFPTFKCITHKRTQYLPQLAAAGADLHTPKGIIETAVSHKDKDAIIYLLDQGVNPNDRCPDGGNTALTTAIRDNNLELVDLLLNHGANPAVRGQDWPLCMAVRNPAILERLLAFPGLNPRAFRGVLEMAVHAGHLESVKLLLKAGVSVEDKNCGVFSPLTTAIREGHKAIVRYLLDEAYADPNAPGEHLPLVKALRSYDGSDVEVIQMLLSRGADINRMHRGWNAVLQAVENSDVEILGLLVSLGGPVDLQAVDETGRPVIDIVGDRDWEEGLALLFPKSSSPPKTKSPSPRGQP